MSFQRDFLSKKITDPLAKIVSDLAKQEYQETFQTQNIDSLNVQILSIKTKTKTLSKDKFHVSIKSYNPDQRFYNAVYPDRNKMKLWLKGENSDKLHDYSLTNHNAHLWSKYQVAEQYQRDDPNNMAGHETVSYSNGTHYIHVQDRKDLRISDLIVDEPSNDGFTIIKRFNPLLYGNSNQDSLILEQKIDSSQNRYGHSVNMDESGNIYFYVRYNYRQYFCKIDKPIPIVLLKANYAADNYKVQNFKTESTLVEGATEILYDLVCQFNYTTKECSIKVLFDDEIIASASSLTGNNSLPSNLQVHLPLQEGKWSETKALPNNLPLNQVYDASPNQFIGTISNPDATATWQENNTLKNTRTTEGGTFISVPNHANIDTLTEFTIGFFAKFDNSINDTTVRYLVRKGTGVNGSFAIYRNTNNSNDLIFTLRLDDGTTHTITFPNAVPLTDDYHYIQFKWKSGEKLKASINNGDEVLSAGIATGTLTLTAAIVLYGLAGTDTTIINFMFFNRQLTTEEQETIYNYGSHLAQFPTNLEPQRLMNPEPPEVTNPVVTIYDLPKIISPTIANYSFINNPSSQSPFIEKYSVPDGVAGGTAQTTVYNVLPGTGGTTVNSFTTVYNLPKPGSPSTGQIQASSEWAYTQRIIDPDSVLIGEKITEITCWLNLNTANGGTIYLGIVRSNLTYITFGDAITPSSIDDGWTQVTRRLTTNSHVMNNGDSVAVIWIGSGRSGSLNIHRGGTDNHYDEDNSGNPLSCQDIAETSSWRTANEDYSMAGIFKTGGETVVTSPYYPIRNASGNNYIVGEVFPTNSPMVGGVPITYVAFRVYRHSGATLGTVSIRHIKADGTYYPTLLSVATSSLPLLEPTTFNLEWQNLDYDKPILAGERIAVVCEGQTSGHVYVLSNIGNSGSGNNYDTTRSYLAYRNYNGTWGGTPSLDIPGIIKKGGNTFTARVRFSSTVTRAYERAININSFFYDQPLSRIIVRGQRFGTAIPSPSTITCRLRNSSNVERAVIGTYDANSVGTSGLGDITFTNNNNTVKVAANDYISIEISTCDATNYIELSISNVSYNGTNSLFGKLENGIIVDQASYDLSGKFYIGGQIDNVSRTRIAQFINTQDSAFLTIPNNRITIFEAVLVRVGAATGTVFINIRRGFDDALIFNLGSVSAGGITTALTGTTIHIENFNNTYILGAKDKISIEYEGGNPTNNIGVQIRSGTNYDGSNSYIARYNGAEYDYFTSHDLVSTMKVGGDTYQPEANAPPPVLPQNPTDLYIMSGIDKKEDSFIRCIFGMYLFFNTLLTDQELINFNITRIDTGNNSPDSIQVTNHSFFRNE